MEPTDATIIGVYFLNTMYSGCFLIANKGLIKKRRLETRLVNTSCEATLIICEIIVH
jgi:hypothetical protein